MREIKGKAIVYGFNSAGTICYSQIIDLHDYYDGNDHVWDSWKGIKALGIVRLVGILFDPDGNITKEWENRYDENSGVITGTRDYSYCEHLKADQKYQKMLARFNELQAQRTDPAV